MLFLQGKNVGNAHMTTVGVNQFEFFSRTNKKVQTLEFLNTRSDLISCAYDLTECLMEVQSEKTEKLMDNVLVSVGSLFSTGMGFAVGVLLNVGNSHWNAFDEELNIVIEKSYREKLNEAKQQGLNAVKKFLQYNHEVGNGIRYDLYPISGDTALKLWKGEFKNWDEVRNYDTSKDEEKNIEILLRSQKDKWTLIYIVETFFKN